MLTPLAAANAYVAITNANTFKHLLHHSTAFSDLKLHITIPSELLLAHFSQPTGTFCLWQLAAGLVLPQVLGR